MDAKTAANELRPRKEAIEYLFKLTDERIMSLFQQCESDPDAVMHAKHLYEANKILQQALRKTLLDGEPPNFKR